MLTFLRGRFLIIHDSAQTHSQTSFQWESFSASHIYSQRQVVSFLSVHWRTLSLQLECKSVDEDKFTSTGHLPSKPFGHAASRSPSFFREKGGYVKNNEIQRTGENKAYCPSRLSIRQSLRSCFLLSVRHKHRFLFFNKLENIIQV